MRYPTIEKILASEKKYSAILLRSRVYESSDDDLPKIFDGNGMVIAEGNTFEEFYEALKTHMQDNQMSVLSLEGEDLEIETEGEIEELKIPPLNEMESEKILQLNF